MALTGRRDGPPLVAAGRSAAWTQEQLSLLGLSIPGLLGERAAYGGLGRNAPWSCGGAFRILPSADGYVGLSLARPSDLDLIPALVEATVDALADPWGTLAEWLASTTSAETEERLRLLALPGGAVPRTPPTDRPGVIVRALGERRRRGDQPPLVVDLTSLWAGPLCAHLLGSHGARIVKVESRSRPDGARRGPAAFFDLLHHGHEQLVLDFDTELDQLRRLIADADLVLEASRPRALRHLGLIAEEVVAAGTSWLSITARGRDSDAVGFGDDVAASAGLVAEDRGRPIPAGDALADPLSGVAAAVAAADALDGQEARLIDVSMLHVAAEASAGEVPEHTVRRAGSGWQVEHAGGIAAVAAPRTRT
jgi:hypothetical protein